MGKIAIGDWGMRQHSLLYFITVSECVTYLPNRDNLYFMTVAQLSLTRELL